MKRDTLEEETCSMARALAVIGDRWGVTDAEVEEGWAALSSLRDMTDTTDAEQG